MKRIALVTGASQGIGKAIAVALAQQDLRVVVAARTQADLEEVARSIREQGGEAKPVVCDVTQPASVAAAVSEIQHDWGDISILVNNAGASGSHKFLGHPDELWHELMNVNLNSVYYVTKAVVPPMIDARWGRIINIASIASKIGGKYLAAYTASKHGVLGLTRALAAEFASYNITVNAICPGYVDTPMTNRSIARIVEHTQMPPDQARAALEKTSLQNRLITPAEVASVAVMLVGENARGITGQAINVDGGAVMS
jgi:NAD(P)-dependent dehydrogenase (short-subunit alcohol dehydrogenase family)